jgi:hypothetical protein
MQTRSIGDSLIDALRIASALICSPWVLDVQFARLIALAFSPSVFVGFSIDTNFRRLA